MSNLNETFALIYLSLSSTDKNNYETVAKSLNTIFNKKLNPIDVKNSLSKYKIIFNFDIEVLFQSAVSIG